MKPIEMMVQTIGILGGTYISYTQFKECKLNFSNTLDISMSICSGYLIGTGMALTLPIPAILISVGILGFYEYTNKCH